MNIMELGAIGELVGGVAVIASLIYVGLQVRGSNRMAVASTTLEASRMIAEWHGRLNRDPDLIAIFSRGVAEPNRLDPAERVRFFTVLAEYFHILEGLYRQQKLGFVSSENWMPIERMTRTLLQLPFVKDWWDSELAIFADDFRSYAESIVSLTDESAYPKKMSRLTR